MSTKRAKAREEKRRKKQQQQFFIIGGIVILLLIAAGFGLYGLDQYNKSYVMTFNGEKIATGDLRFCSLFAEVGENEDAKEKALDQLLTYLVMEQAAKDNGLALTEEELEETRSYAESFKSYYQQYYNVDFSSIDNDRMLEMLGLDVLYDQLLEKYTADYTVNEADFSKALADYIKNEPADYTVVNLKYIYASDAATIEEARQAIEDGMTFDDAVIKYSEYYSEESGVETYEMKYMGLDDETMAQILTLSPGDITSTIDTNSMSAMFYVDSITVPEESEISATYRERYISEQKNARFTEIVDEWKKNANYTLNQKGYDAA